MIYTTRPSQYSSLLLRNDRRSLAICYQPPLLFCTLHLPPFLGVFQTYRPSASKRTNGPVDCDFIHESPKTPLTRAPYISRECTFAQ
uniref:Ovule protein n=1 Tax=Heterorhabditis bacteriophora TaxID=37862 RepID=A0A1I7W6Y7_HETBA